MCLTELYEAPTPQVPSNPAEAQKLQGCFKGEGDIKTNEEGQRLDWYSAGREVLAQCASMEFALRRSIQRFNLHDDDYHESIAQDAACARAFL